MLREDIELSYSMGFSDIDEITRSNLLLPIIPLQVFDSRFREKVILNMFVEKSRFLISISDE